MDSSDAWSLASDSELVAAIRAGDPSACVALRERHAPAAEAVVRASAADEDEIGRTVADVFERVFEDLRAGDWPDGSFRPQLCFEAAAVAECAGAGTRPADGRDDVAVVAAFRSLVPRWREVLWYVHVERLEPAAVAPVLGLSGRQTADLATFAHRGLRQAYRRQEVVGHELTDVGHALRTHVAPAYLGSAAASALVGVGFGGALAAIPDEAGVDAHVAEPVQTDRDGAPDTAGAVAHEPLVATRALPLSAPSVVDVDAPGPDADGEGRGTESSAGASTGVLGAAPEADPGKNGLVMAASSGLGLLALALFMASTVGAFDSSAEEPTPTSSTSPLSESGFVSAPAPLTDSTWSLAIPRVGLESALPVPEPAGEVLAFTGDAGASTGSADLGASVGSAAARRATGATAAADDDAIGARRTPTPAATPTVGPPPATIGTRPAAAAPRPAAPPAARPAPSTPPIVATPASPPTVVSPPTPPVVPPTPTVPPVVRPPAPTPTPTVPPVVRPPTPTVPPPPADPGPTPEPPAPPVVDPDPPVTPPDDEDDDEGNGRRNEDGRGNGDDRDRDRDRGRGNGDDRDRGRGRDRG